VISAPRNQALKADQSQIHDQHGADHQTQAEQAHREHETEADHDCHTDGMTGDH
jgi:hypothetical protein